MAWNASKQIRIPLFSDQPSSLLLYLNKQTNLYWWVIKVIDSEGWRDSIPEQLEFIHTENFTFHSCFRVS